MQSCLLQNYYCLWKSCELPTKVALIDDDHESQKFLWVGMYVGREYKREGWSLGCLLVNTIKRVTVWRMTLPQATEWILLQYFHWCTTTRIEMFIYLPLYALLWTSYMASGNGSNTDRPSVNLCSREEDERTINKNWKCKSRLCIVQQQYLSISVVFKRITDSEIWRVLTFLTFSWPKMHKRWLSLC